MRLITDTRENLPLVFPKVDGVEYIVETVSVGDYTSWHDDLPDPAVVERKSLPDLFSSFTSNYDAERRKIKKAESLQLQYILAIEGSATQILQGHTYWAKGQVQESKKSGLAMLKQLMTVQRKYQISIWFCSGRRDMAIRIQEYFLAMERIKP